VKKFIFNFVPAGLKLTKDISSHIPHAPGKIITQEIEATKNDITIKTVNSIAQVPREHWDALVEDNPYMTWGWLKTVEETCINKHDTYYIMATNLDQLIGGAVCSNTKRSLREHNLDNMIFGRLKKLFYCFNINLTPLLDCSPPIGRRTQLLVNNSLDEETKQKISEALFEKIENLASSNKLAVAFSGVKEDQVGLRKTLAKRGYCYTLGYPIGILDIKWSDFNDYLLDKKAISSKMRTTIRAQIKRNKKAEVVISEIKNPEKHGNRLHQLSSINCEKHNKVPFSFNEYFYEQAKKNLGDEAAIFIAEKKGVVVGVQILLKRKGYGNGCIIGIDHENCGNDFTYFNLAYYTSIQDAIHSNMKSIDFGNGLYDVKTRHGCHLYNNYLYYRPATLLQKLFIPLWFRFHSFWFERKLSDHVKSHLRKIT
jgi:predicted N-acyltransferase